MQLFGYTKLLTYVNAKMICLFPLKYGDCELMKMILQNFADSSSNSIVAPGGASVKKMRWGCIW
jgi:hypothetical protein